MSPAVWGGLLAGLATGGLLLATARLRVIHRPQLADRVLPYLRDLPGAEDRPGARVPFGPQTGRLAWLATALDRTLGGAPTIRLRLDRADLDRTVADFRVEQVTWGLAAFGVAAAFGLLNALEGAGGAASSLLVCLLAFLGGVLARDTHLTGQVKQRERQILAEFPTVAELLALAVAAGEGPVAALDRVVLRSGGALSSELSRVLAEIRTGQPVGAAFDRLAASTGLPVVARFAHGIAVAVERGTPLSDVLHAQAADVREAGRRELIEVAARREVLMMVPVVFLVLPVTVLFAFWPGVVGLHLSTP